jgi:hypothetical protein
MFIRLRLLAPIVAAHLVVYGFAHAENDASPYLSQRKAGIAQGEKMVLEHTIPSPAAVKFRKIRYFEHYSTVGGRRVLTAIVLCGQLKTGPQKGAPYRRFFSWVFMDLATGRYDENKYVVAVNDPDQTVDLYTHHHFDVCSNSEDGLSLENRIGISKYQ